MFHRKSKPEQATIPRAPVRIRAVRKVKVTDENQRIVWKYIEAVEDAAREGKLSHTRVVERMGL